MVELMMAVGVFAILAVTSVNLFFSSLIGTGKETVLREIKQNGEFAANQIEDTLRGVKIVNTCQAGMTTLDYETLDGDTGSLGLEGDVKKRIVFGAADEYLTAQDVNVDQFLVDCYQDPATGVTFVTINFGIAKGGSDDRPEERWRQDFTASVTLRNK